MNDTINDWSFYQKKGFQKLKSKLLRQDLQIKNIYYRNFEFTYNFIPQLEKLLEIEFGKTNVKLLDIQTKKNKQDKIYFQSYEIISNDLLVTVQGDIEEKPYWGYFAILKLNDRNRNIAIKLSKKIDNIMLSFPSDLENYLIWGPIIQPNIYLTNRDFKLIKFLVKPLIIILSIGTPILATIILFILNEPDYLFTIFIPFILIISLLLIILHQHLRIVESKNKKSFRAGRGRPAQERKARGG
jgi:hypothetical protein